MRQYNTGTIDGSAERSLLLKVEKIANWNIFALAAKKYPLNRSANEWKERL